MRAIHVSNPNGSKGLKKAYNRDQLFEQSWETGEGYKGRLPTFPCVENTVQIKANGLWEVLSGMHVAIFSQQAQAAWVVPLSQHVMKSCQEHFNGAFEHKSFWFFSTGLQYMYHCFSTNP
jgi:hypothetical protein